MDEKKHWRGLRWPVDHQGTPRLNAQQTCVSPTPIAVVDLLSIFVVSYYREDNLLFPLNISIIILIYFYYLVYNCTSIYQPQPQEEKQLHGFTNIYHGQIDHSRSSPRGHCREPLVIAGRPGFLHEGHCWRSHCLGSLLPIAFVLCLSLIVDSQWALTAGQDWGSISITRG